jgi:hypothetical protein
VPWGTSCELVDIAFLLLHASSKLSQPCYGLPSVEKRQRIGQQTIPAAAEAALLLSSRRGYAFDTPALLLCVCCCCKVKHPSAASGGSSSSALELQGALSRVSDEHAYTLSKRMLP